MALWRVLTSPSSDINFLSLRVENFRAVIRCILELQWSMLWPYSEPFAWICFRGSFSIVAVIHLLVVIRIFIFENPCNHLVVTVQWWSLQRKISLFLFWFTSPAHMVGWFHLFMEVKIPQLIYVNLMYAFKCLHVWTLKVENICSGASFWWAHFYKLTILRLAGF